MSKGGSSWPGNLAIVTKVTNQEKKDSSAQQYWRALNLRYGEPWVQERKQLTIKIDKQRKRIHQNRTRKFKHELSQIAFTVENEFPNHFVELTMDKDTISMTVGKAEVTFPKGLPRKRNLFKSAEYFLDLARLLAV